MEEERTVGSKSIAGFFKIAFAVVCVGVVWRCCKGCLITQPALCPTYGGFVHEDFEDVKDAFVKNIITGYYTGVAFSVHYNGQVLVDLWGGCADQGSSKPWTENTLTQAWSTTKGVTAIVLGHLVSRGKLNYTERVAHYWPEFAQNDKENITVAMMLSHQAGLSSLQRQLTLMEYRDAWSQVEDMLATQKPLWEPGTKYNYHAFTFGMYADALIRKIDDKHRNITQYFKEEIADPFSIDFYIGLPRGQFHRSTIATYTPFWKMYVDFLLRPENWPFLPQAMANSDVLYNSMQVLDFVNDFDVLNQEHMRTVGLSSSHGFGTARSLARLFDYVANNGTVRGKTLLSPDTISVLATPITENTPVIAAPRFPISSLGSIIEPNRHGGRTVGHRGYGGQHAFGDMAYKVGVAYLTNDNHGSGDVEDPRVTNVLDALYDNLKKFNQKPL